LIAKNWTPFSYEVVIADLAKEVTDTDMIVL